MKEIHLKSSIAAIALIISSFSCYSQPQPNERDQLIKSFEEVMRPSSLRVMKLAMGGNFNRLLDSDKRLNPEVPQEKWNQIAKEYETEIERVFSQPAGFTMLVAKDVSTEMTSEELRQVIAFLNTDAGRKYAASSERMAKLTTTPQFRAVLSMSTLELYSAKVNLLGNKHGLKVAPLELGR